MSNRPRIAIVNTVHNSGGAAKAAVTLLNGLNKPSVMADAKMFHCGDTNKDDSLIGLKRRGSRLSNVIFNRFNGSMKALDYGVASEILERTKNYDILNVHNLHGYYLNYEKLLTEWGSRPIVWTWHDMWGATGRCGFSYDCDLWLSGCPTCPNKTIYPAAWIDRASTEFQRKFELFTGFPNLQIVTPSAWLSDLAVRRGYDSKKISTIPNAVRTDIFCIQDKQKVRRKLNLGSNMIALFVAYDCNDSRKGYHDFAKATQQVGCDAIAIGRLPDNPAANIKHVGPLSNAAQLSLYYAAADVMIIPSYADNYPNTVLESLCCGTPVIGYSVGGLASLLTQYGCLSVAQGDVEQLGNVLARQFSEDMEQASSISIAKSAHAKWSPFRIAEQYLDIMAR